MVAILEPTHVSPQQADDLAFFALYRSNVTANART